MEIICGRFRTNAVKSWMPAWTSCGIAPPIADTIAPIICGSAATIVVMICGNAPIKAVSSWIPASMSCGIAPTTPLTIAVIICGSAATIAVMI